MRYLADTQIFIWALISPEKLAPKNQEILQNNEIFISQISLFEIAIKQKIGKLPELALSIDDLTAQIQQDNFNLLPLSNAHLAAYDAIPLLENHRDPFDRLLLATALSENIPVISADPNFVDYMPQIQLIDNKQ